MPTLGLTPPRSSPLVIVTDSAIILPCTLWTVVLCLPVTLARVTRPLWVTRVWTVLSRVRVLPLVRPIVPLITVRVLVWVLWTRVLQLVPTPLVALWVPVVPLRLDVTPPWWLLRIPSSGPQVNPVKTVINMKKPTNRNSKALPTSINASFLLVADQNFWTRVGR